MLELAELRGDRGADARLAVAEQVHPPRRHGVEDALPVEVLEPHAFGARDRHERQRLVRLHLRARVPDRREAPPKPARSLPDPSIAPEREVMAAGAYSRAARRVLRRSTAATSSRAMPGLAHRMAGVRHDDELGGRPRLRERVRRDRRAHDVVASLHDRAGQVLDPVHVAEELAVGEEAFVHEVVRLDARDRERDRVALERAAARRAGAAASSSRSRTRPTRRPRGRGPRDRDRSGGGGSSRAGRRARPAAGTSRTAPTLRGRPCPSRA